MVGKNLGKKLGNKPGVAPRAWGDVCADVGQFRAAKFGFPSPCPGHLAPRPASPLPTSSSSSLKSKREARAVLGQLPLIFEPNQGQADLRAKFLARGAGYSLFLGTTGAVLGMQTAHTSLSDRSEQFVEMKLVGANPAAALTGADPLPGKTNYIVGNNPQKWHSDVPQFAGFATRAFILGLISFSMETRAIWNTTSASAPAPIHREPNCSLMEPANWNSAAAT